jgi:hypothetical protein
MAKNVQQNKLEKKFWDVVDQINWKKLCQEHRDPVKFGRRIVRTKLDLSLEEIHQLYDECTRLYNNLKDRAELECMRRCGHKDVNCIKPDIPKLKNTSVSDDGFNDMLHHVIGLGKERYYEAMNDID